MMKYALVVLSSDSPVLTNIVTFSVLFIFQTFLNLLPEDKVSSAAVISVVSSKYTFVINYLQQ